MYEAEANCKVESIEQLPAEVAQKFREFRQKVIARTVLPWGEHCTECVWPTCYDTCDLYSPREDGSMPPLRRGNGPPRLPGRCEFVLAEDPFQALGKALVARECSSLCPGGS